MPYDGLISEIPLGLGGIISDSGAAKAPLGSLQDSNNTIFENGEILKEGGTQIISQAPITGGDPILRTLDYFPTSTVQRLITITSTGRLSKDDGFLDLNDTLLKTGLSIGNTVPSLLTGGAEVTPNPRKMFVATGNDPVQVLTGDGITVSDLASPPADWTGADQPVYLFLHINRLYALKDDFLYGSLATNHEDFVSAGTKLASIYPDIGIELISGISAFGKIFLFKRPRGVFLFDATDDSVKLINPAVSIAGPYAWSPLGDDFVILSDQGQFLLLSSIDREPDFEAASLSNFLGFNKFIRNNFNLETQAISRSQGAFYPLKQRAMFCMPATGSPIPNRMLTLENSNVLGPSQGNVKPFFASKDVCESLTLRRDSEGIERPIITDSSGNVLQLDDPNLNVSGSSYEGMFHISDTDMSHLDRRFAGIDKQLDFVEFLTNNPGNWDLFIEVFSDGFLCDSFNLSLGDRQFILDVDQLDVGKLGGRRFLARRGYPNCCGRIFSIRASQSGLNQGFSVSKMILGFRPIEEQTNV